MSVKDLMEKVRQVFCNNATFSKRSKNKIMNPMDASCSSKIDKNIKGPFRLTKEKNRKEDHIPVITILDPDRNTPLKIPGYYPKIDYADFGTPQTSTIQHEVNDKPDFVSSSNGKFIPPSPLEIRNYSPIMNADYVRLLEKKYLGK